MIRSAAEILREYGPFPGVDHVHGVTFDGQHVWFAAGDKLNAFDPASGKMLRSLDVAAHAGTAFDGQHLFQIAEDRSQRVDPKTGRVRATIPAPGGGADSGLAWAEGTLWVGQYRDRKIHQVDPQTGAVLRTIESNRFVTGVTWVDGELWHGTWEGDASEIRRVDPESGAVLDRLEMPAGVGVSGLESDGADLFYAGGGESGKVRAVRRQLLVQHFMLGPSWEQGCPSCSFMADHTDGMLVHLTHRDVSFVAVSRAPLAEIKRFKERMGWRFRWVSSSANDFNKDFHVS